MDNKKTEEIGLISGRPPRPQKSKIPRKLRGKFAAFAKDLQPKTSKWEIGFQNQNKQLKLIK